MIKLIDARETLKIAFTQKLKVQSIETQIQDQKKINQSSRAKIIELTDKHKKEQALLMELIMV